MILFILQKIDAQAIEEFYGLTSDISKNSESGYILFYQSREWLGKLWQLHTTTLQAKKVMAHWIDFYKNLILYGWKMIYSASH